jgi:hypothetical protein
MLLKNMTYLSFIEYHRTLNLALIGLNASLSIVAATSSFNRQGYVTLSEQTFHKHLQV